MINKSLKKIRKSKGLTQAEAAAGIGISLRSYISYENDPQKAGTPKYRFLLSEVEQMNRLDEEHGILTLQEIRENCASVFHSIPVDYCILFGSYAKEKASETSDVDLLVSTNVTGLRYYELAERLRETLHKNVDLLDLKQLINNESLLNEILRDGIRIYRQHQE